MTANILRTTKTQELINGIKNIDVEVSTGKYFTGLKLIRELIPVEEKILEGDTSPPLASMMPEQHKSEMKTLASGAA